MTIGPVPAWLVWLVAAFALVGAYAAWRMAAAWCMAARDWWRDRREPLPGENLAAHGTLRALPPERSREELGFTGEQPAISEELTTETIRAGMDAMWHGPHRAPWWEVQQRDAYESLGLDYPSGLLARVREAGR